MTLGERLRWATAPDPRRSRLLLWSGLVPFLLAASALMNWKPAPAAEALLLAVLAAGWGVGACGAIGYLRWLFRRSAAEAAEDRRPPRG